MNKYALLGHPLTHSCSPIIHNELFKQNNINATYELLDILEDEILEYLNKIRKGIYQGYNVTIPYKEKVMPYLDSLTDAAKIIGAVNVIYLRDGKLIGDNSDFYGFILQLKHQKIDVKNKNVYVLGNGGAAKAIIYALKLMNANVTVVSRRSGFSYDDLANLSKIDVLINTTPVGMYPNVDASPVSEEVISKTETCIDIIFNPRKTKFLQLANQKNEGLPMLIFQAIKAEEIWQGHKIDYQYEEIEKACERKLGVNE